MNYRDARVTTLQLLYDGKISGLFQFQEPIAPDVLKRIREAVPQSIHMALEMAEILEEQGLVYL